MPEKRRALPIGLMICWLLLARLGLAEQLPGTEPLTLQGDLAMEMVAGIDRFLRRELEASVARRAEFWRQDFASPEQYRLSVEPNRQRFAKRIGVVDPRPGRISLELVASTTTPSLAGAGKDYTVTAVRWPALKGMMAEGLYLQPKGQVKARIVALGDADWSPEMLAGLTGDLPVGAQFARRLAGNRCEVLVPVLIDRADTWSGNPRIRMTNQPHREYIYRMAFEMGRHVIGYEVQKVLAAVDFFKQRSQESHLPVGVIGYGEDGLLALYSAAADPRIDAACVSGYFQSRQEVWREPIYRNVWGLLEEFGDAELASLICPRPLVIEASHGPQVDGPPQPREGRSGAAPGHLATPPLESYHVPIRGILI